MPVRMMASMSARCTPASDERVMTELSQVTWNSTLGGNVDSRLCISARTRSTVCTSFADPALVTAMVTAFSPLTRVSEVWRLNVSSTVATSPRRTVLPPVDAMTRLRISSRDWKSPVTRRLICWSPCSIEPPGTP